MKILVLSQYYLPDITAAAFRISETVRFLEEWGHEVKVITTYPHKSKTARDAIKFEDERQVYRCKLPDTEGKGFLGYLYHYLSFLVKSIGLGRKVKKERWKPDVIWASSPPIFVGFGGVVLSNIFKKPLVLDIRDIWPQSAVSAGQISETGMPFKLAGKLENYLYDRADRITCVARPMKQYIQSLTETPIEVIYNGVDLSTFEAPDRSENLTPIKSITYAGNLGHVQQLDLLLKAFAALYGQGESNGWSITFFGDGAQRKNLKKLAFDLDIASHVTFRGTVSKQEALAGLRKSGLLFLSLQPDPVFELTIPSKVFDYMMVGRPVIAGIRGEGREILEASGTSYLFEPGDQTDLEKTLKTAFDEQEKDSRAENYSNEILAEHYSRERMSQKLEKMFKELYQSNLRKTR